MWGGGLGFIPVPEQGRSLPDPSGGLRSPGSVRSHRPVVSHPGAPWRGIVAAPRDPESPQGPWQPPATVAAPLPSRLPTGCAREVLCHILMAPLPAPRGCPGCPSPQQCPLQSSAPAGRAPGTGNTPGAEATPGPCSWPGWHSLCQPACGCAMGGAQHHRGASRGLGQGLVPVWPCSAPLLLLPGHGQGPSTSQDRDRLLPQAALEMLSCALLRELVSNRCFYFPCVQINKSVPSQATGSGLFSKE